MAARSDDATQNLSQLAAGNDRAADRLLPLVYDELRALAGRYLREEKAGHTLQPTALVHEAYLRLIRTDEIQWRGRSQFLALAATTLRRILIDHARRRLAQKRGGGLRLEPLDEEGLQEERTVSFLEFEEILTRLAAVDEQQSRIVELRFLGGLTIEETASVLGIEAEAVRSDWRFARAWLKRELRRAAERL
jgi:RNA polymerase sigma factor (TIGR02999 family)